MPLPTCLTCFDAPTYYELACNPKRFYEGIVSRIAHGMRLSTNEVVFWSYVAPVRCIMTAAGLKEYVRDGYRVCVLREFDDNS